jgi:hypothetical protein
MNPYTIRRDLNKTCSQPYRTLTLHSRGVVLCLGQSEGSEDVEVPLCTSCSCKLGLSPILKTIIKSLNADGFTLSPHALSRLDTLKDASRTHIVCGR